MALVKDALKTQIIQGLQNIHPNKDDPNGAINAFADVISNAVDAFVRSAVVTVQPGQEVTTPAGPGATSSPGTGSLS